MSYIIYCRKTYVRRMFSFSSPTENLCFLLSVLHSFSIKNIFYDKVDLSLLYFHVTIFRFDLGCASIR